MFLQIRVVGELANDQVASPKSRWHEWAPPRAQDMRLLQTLIPTLVDEVKVVSHVNNWQIEQMKEKSTPELDSCRQLLGRVCGQ